MAAALAATAAATSSSAPESCCLVVVHVALVLLLLVNRKMLSAAGCHSRPATPSGLLWKLCCVCLLAANWKLIPFCCRLSLVSSSVHSFAGSSLSSQVVRFALAARQTITAGVYFWPLAGIVVVAWSGDSNYSTRTTRLLVRTNRPIGGGGGRAHTQCCSWSLSGSNFVGPRAQPTRKQTRTGARPARSFASSRHWPTSFRLRPSVLWFARRRRLLLTSRANESEQRRLFPSFAFVCRRRRRP